MPTSPKCVAIIFCEDIEDDGNGNLSLMKTFDALGGTAFPLQHDVTFYVLFTDGRHDVDVDIRVVALDDEGDPNADVCGGARGKARLSPLSYDNVHGTMPLTFPAPGTYLCEIIVGGVMVASRKLPVRDLR